MLSPRSKLIFPAILLAFAVLNGRFLYEDLQFDLSAEGTASSIAEPGHAVQLHKAGFPFTYYESSSNGDGESFAAFYLWALSADGCIALFVAWACAWSLRPSRQAGGLKVASGMQPWYLSSRAALAGGLLCGFISWTYAGHREQTLVDAIEKLGGSVEMVCSAPKMLEDWIPQPCQGLFDKVVAVELVRANESQLAQALQLRSLRKIRIEDCDLGEATIGALAKLIQLRELRLQHEEFNAALLAEIGECQQLQSLSLSGSGVSEEGLTTLGTMPNLRQLDLTEAEVELSGERVPVWATGIKRLLLACASEGRRHHLAGWPSLESLYVCQGLKSPSGPAGLSLSGLPKLRELVFCGTPPIDLKLQSLPELRRVVRNDGFAEHQRVAAELRDAETISRSHGMPLRLRRFVIDELPRLNELRVAAQDVEGFRIAETPKLDFQLVTELDGVPASSSTSVQRDSSGVPQGRKQAWIDSYGFSTGVREVNLDGVLLRGIDFSTFARNDSLECLSLVDCQVSYAQLASLRGHPRLSAIDISGSTWVGSQLADLVNSLPQLRSLRADQRCFDRFKLVGHGSIERLIGRRQREEIRMDAVHLENLPNLREVIELASDARYVYLSGLPKLRGVVFHASAPEQTHLEGLEALQVFCGGGTLSEEAIDAILLSPMLERLTLAHAALTPAQIERIGSLRRLQQLCLTGTPLEQNATSGWQLTRIQQLRLDQTSLSADAVLGHLPHRNSIRELWIDRLNEEDWTELGQLSQLRRLGIGESHLGLTAVQSMHRLRRLQSLALMSCGISSEAMVDLAQKPLPALDRLVLMRTSVEETAILKLADSVEQLRFELETQGSSAGLLRTLEARGQLEGEGSSPSRFVRRQSASPGSRYGEVSPEEFAPRESSQGFN